MRSVSNVISNPPTVSGRCICQNRQWVVNGPRHYRHRSANWVGPEISGWHIIVSALITLIHVCVLFFPPIDSLITNGNCLQGGSTGWSIYRRTEWSSCATIPRKAVGNHIKIHSWASMSIIGLEWALYIRMVCTSVWYYSAPSMSNWKTADLYSARKEIARKFQNNEIAIMGIL